MTSLSILSFGVLVPPKKEEKGKLEIGWIETGASGMQDCVWFIHAFGSSHELVVELDQLHGNDRA